MSQVKHSVVADIGSDEHQFEVPAGEDEELTLRMRITHEGIIIDIADDSGEVIKTAYQFWCDLEEMAH